MSAGLVGHRRHLSAGSIPGRAQHGHPQGVPLGCRAATRRRQDGGGGPDAENRPCRRRAGAASRRHPPTPAPLPEFSPAATAAASSAPPPSSSPAAAPEARTDAVSAAGGEPTAVAPLEIAKDYPGLLLRYLRDKPDLAQNADSVRWWAAYRYGEEFRRLQNQEFKIAPVLERAKADLAASLAKSDPERIVVVLATQFGSYDFSRQMFPLSLGGIRSITVSAPLDHVEQQAAVPVHAGHQ